MSTDIFKTPVTYYGGKQRMLKHILPLIPPHNLYNEPFVGGAAVFFAKEPANVEVINDTNDALITFYRIMKEKPEELIKKIKTTLHSRKLHQVAWDMYCCPEQYSDVERAWSLWILTSQGFASQINKHWGVSKNKNKMPKHIQNAKGRFTEELCLRLEQTQIECADALHVTQKYDTEDAFHYIDPPYFNSDCGHYGGYTEADFEKLLILLSEIKGKFILSSYPSNVLNDYTTKHNWRQRTIKQPISVKNKNGKTKNKTEVLTANFDI